MSGDHTAFFYGTLMAPEVFYSVCYGVSNPPQAIKDLHTFSPSILQDHCRHRVQHADYPGVVPEKGRSVRGILATGLTDANMHKLDIFEGSEYERANFQVRLLNTVDGQEVDGEMRNTSVYLFIQPERLERGEWDFESFKNDKLKFWTRGDWAFDDTDRAKVASE